MGLSLFQLMVRLLAPTEMSMVLSAHSDVNLDMSSLVLKLELASKIRLTVVNFKNAKVCVKTCCIIFKYKFYTPY